MKLDVPLAESRRTTILRLASAAGIALSFAFPFVRVGRKSRSAFETLRSARVLGLTDGPFRFCIALAVILTPAMLGLLVLLHAAHPSTRRAQAIRGVSLAIATVGGTVGCVGLWVSRLRLTGPPIATGCAALLYFITIQGLPRVRVVDEPS